MPLSEWFDFERPRPHWLKGPEHRGPVQQQHYWWFDGDMFHGPGFTDLERGVACFFPLTWGRRGYNMTLSWASSGRSLPPPAYHEGVWLPEDDPVDFRHEPTSANVGKQFEVWQETLDNITPQREVDFELSSQDRIEGFEYLSVMDPLYFARFMVGPVYRTLGGFQRHATLTNGGGTAVLHNQYMAFWDISNLPNNSQIDRIELWGDYWYQGHPDDHTMLNFRWFYPDDLHICPYGFPGTHEDYDHRPGDAWRGPTERFISVWDESEMVELVEDEIWLPRPLELRNVDQLDLNKGVIGLRGSLDPFPAMPLRDGGHAVGWQRQAVYNMDPEWFNNVWDDYLEDLYSGNVRLGPVQMAVVAMPHLRIYFSEKECAEPEEEKHFDQIRHWQARQIRAHHSGRFPSVRSRRG